MIGYDQFYLLPHLNFIKCWLQSSKLQQSECMEEGFLGEQDAPFKLHNVYA
jgi:hypothetical protein